MKKTILITLIVSAILAMTGCTQSHSKALFNGKNMDGWTMYLKDTNVDPATVWSVKDGVIHCTGKPNGYIRTKENYSNYKLHLEWRWVDKPSNSGVLLHTVGDDKLWPQCIEAQLMHQQAGDFIVMAEGSSITVNGRQLKRSEDKSSHVARRQQDSTEKSAGQWNSYDIICQGTNIELYVNGTLQNKAADSSLTEGAICLQSEGAPIEFRNISMTPMQ